MVFVNSKKFACESCIKGHRSSSCHHADRPLFEIKRKGRPVSQCEKCREARSTRRIHARCTCNPSGAESSTRPVGSREGKRFIPTVPTLPNGLRDAFRDTCSSSSRLSDARNKVDLLLNPCRCKDVWSCKCRSQDTSSNSNVERTRSSSRGDGLAALAQAAASCSPVSAEHADSLTIASPSGRELSPQYNYRSSDVNTSCCDTKFSDSKFTHVVSKSGPNTHAIQFNSLLSEEGQEVRPIFPIDTQSAIRQSHSKDSCYCGHQCACPDCALHRGIESSKSATDKEGREEPCLNCVDHEGGIELPGHKPQTTFLDEFFARAATLPTPPPGNRARPKSLDPMNVIVYPPSLISRSNSSEKSEREARELAFGLVNLPKLECCGGRCSCPDHNCSCGDECGGCCVDKNAGESASSVFGSIVILNSDVLLQSLSGITKSTASASSSKGNCCS